MNRRNFLRFGGAATILGAFPSSGLGEQSSPTTSNQAQDFISEAAMRLANGRDLSITIFYPKGSFSNIKPAAAIFEAKTNIKILFKEAPVDDINSVILLDNLNDVSSFDIAIPATFGIPDLAQANAILNLDDFAKKYEPADFQEQSLYTIGDYYKGNLFGYQTDGDAYVMFYNRRFMDDIEAGKRFFGEHGYALKTPSTWEELEDVMSFFHNPEEGIYGGSLFRTADYLPWEWWIRFHSKGYFPLNDVMEAQINNEAGIEALEELIAASAYLDPRTKTDGLFENWASFAEGNSVCNIGWGGSQKFFNSEKSMVREQLRFGPTPGGVVDGKLIQTPYFNWGWNYVVSSKSKEAEIAYLFCLFACSPSVSAEAISVKDGYFDPFRKTHYEDPRIIEAYSKNFLETHRFSMENAIPDLYLDGQGEYFSALRENLAAAVSGQLTPKKALDLTASQWNVITFRIGKASQLEQWNFLKSRYPEALTQQLK